MSFFSPHPRRTERVSARHSLFRWRFSGMIVCLLSLALISLLVPALPALATTHSRQGHPINLQALRQGLKQKIRVTHTGNVRKAQTTPHVHGDLQPAYNNVAISDDQNTAAGNFDAQGNSYSAQALQNLGLMPGLTITTNNITYTWPNVPSGADDNYQAAGQVLSVPPISDAATIGFLGAATNGDTSGTATLTFTDGSVQTFTLGLTDWTLGQGQQSSPSFGNTLVETAMPTSNTSINQQPLSVYLFSAQQALPAGKTLQSVTLPTSVSGGQLHIFAIGLSEPAYNNTATSDDSSTTKADFDMQGNSYSAQALQSVGISSGEQIASDDMAYTWPTASSGSANNYLASGQILPVTPVANATTLGFLGSATNGPTSGTATLTYTDGSTQSFTLGLSDWATQQPSFSNMQVATMTYLNTKSGRKTLNVYLFTTEVALSQGKTLQSVTLPTTVSGGQLHVFAVSTASALNNVGTSQDSATGSGNYDNQHSSFSVQALQAAGVTPGQPFLFKGISFPWPQSDGVTGDNYQAAGQVISLTPVAQASVLAFIGSATNGNTSGSATLTYTDGSTQPFTLGMTDWSVGTPQYGNQLALTTPYRNALSGKQSSSYYLYYAETSLQASKTLQSVTLPTTLSGGQLHIFSISTRSPYNNIGISDDSNPTGANFDGNGTSYSAQDFSDPNGPGWNPGDTLTYEGINYIWPGVPTGQSDNYAANGQTIPVTPVAGATTIGFVGSATNAFPGSSGTATLTYTDGSTQTFTLGMTDWLMDGGSATPLASNRLFAVLPHINNRQGQQATNAYLFETETALNTGKTLQSVTLPGTVNQNLHVFMIGTRSGTDFMNNVGTSDDAQTKFASFDSNGASNGASYSNQALQAAGLYAGQPFISRGVSFTWSPSYSVAPDNYQAAGQNIPITPLSATNTLAFLGAATHGSSSGTATITYTDGTTQTFTLGFADWNISSISSLPYNNIIAASMSYRNTVNGQQTINTYVFETEVTVQASKTIQSVTLPTTVTGGELHVFSVGTRAGTYNNAGTSDDALPSAGNFDGNGASYSAQALNIAGFTPGQTTTINGVDFLWPNVNAGIFNNYTAAGQTLPVTPVAGATTLAFLGASTNTGSSAVNSGTATITYTDGTTSTFTLSLTDWWNATPLSGNQIAATSSYINYPAGRKTGSFHLYYSEVPLPTGQTIQSVTLPSSVSSGQMHIFSLGTRGGALNNAGVSNDAHPLFSNFDGHGNSYSAQALSAAGFTAGRTVKVNGISFTWPKAAAGQCNNYLAARQKIALTPRTGARTLAFLGSATHGPASGTVTITYTDGSTQTFRLGFADWTTASTHALPYGDTVAVILPYHNSPTGKQKLKTFLFEASVLLRAGKTVQSITLPASITQGQVHVFAIGLK